MNNLLVPRYLHFPVIPKSVTSRFGGKEEPRAFLLEGGAVRWTGRDLEGVLGEVLFPVDGGLDAMRRLERSGWAVSTGKGFWICPICPHCRGAVTPEFECCAAPYG